MHLKVGELRVDGGFRHFLCVNTGKKQKERK